MPNIALEQGKNAESRGVKSAYGETQEIDGTQFTPVALTFSGFAGGSTEENDGAAGSHVAIPLGVYVRREEGMRFEPNVIALLTVAIPFVWTASRAISRVIRAFKK